LEAISESAISSEEIAAIRGETCTKVLPFRI